MNYFEEKLKHMHCPYCRESKLDLDSGFISHKRGVGIFDTRYRVQAAIFCRKCNASGPVERIVRTDPMYEEDMLKERKKDLAKVQEMAFKSFEKIFVTNRGF